MTKGQEISYYIRDHTPREIIAKKIDAALAEAVSQRTRECGAIAEKYTRCPETDIAETAGLIAAEILALDEPPVPVWEHKPNCPTPYQWTGISGMEWRCISTDDGVVCIFTDKRFHHCPGCGTGKPRPVTP